MHQAPESIPGTGVTPLPASGPGELLFAVSPAIEWRRIHAPFVHAAPIGRERDLETVRRLLQDGEVRLVTLTGPAGVGKTHIALAALEARSAHAPRVVFVNAGNVRDGSLLAAAIARTLGIHSVQEGAAFDLLANALDSEPYLLVLDNFEHLLGVSATIAALLGMCPQLRTLITSRVALGIRWEHEVPIQPLPVPDLRRELRLKELAQCPSVRLFVQRARAVQPGFNLTEANAAAIATVCSRLEGLPLALEMAAARIKLLPPKAMLDALERPLELLTGGPDRSARHQSARHAISWSYQLLEPADRCLLRRLSVFEGGCDLDGVRHVLACAADTLPELPGNPLDRLMTLVHSNLLSQDEQSDGQPRFRLLELVREYAREQAAVSGEWPLLERRQAEWCLAFMIRARGGLTGSDQAAWLDRLEIEQPNIRSALRFAVAQQDAALGMGLAAIAWRFWQARGDITEGRRWIATLLEMPVLSHQAVQRGAVLIGAGVLALGQGDLGPARTSFEAALVIARDAGDVEGAVRALTCLGRVALADGDAETARTHTSESVELSRAAGLEATHAVALHYLGLAELRRGEIERARTCFEASRAVFLQLGDEWSVRLSLRGLGLVAFKCREFGLARSLIERSAALSRHRGDLWSLGVLLHDLGYVLQVLGDRTAAADAFRESLLIRRRLSNAGGIALCIVGLAGLAAEQEQAVRAAHLFGAAEAMRHTRGIALEITDQDRYDHYVALTRSLLGEDGFASAWAEGRVFSTAEAIDCALDDRNGSAAGGRGSPGKIVGVIGRLTTRERQVLDLINRGLSNRQIADDLVITEGTAALHVKHILHKLGFASRAQVAAWSADQKLAQASADASRTIGGGARRSLAAQISNSGEVVGSSGF